MSHAFYTFTHPTSKCVKTWQDTASFIEYNVEKKGFQNGMIKGNVGQIQSFVVSDQTQVRSLFSP